MNTTANLKLELKKVRIAKLRHPRGLVKEVSSTCPTIIGTDESSRQCNTD